MYIKRFLIGAAAAAMVLTSCGQGTNSNQDVENEAIEATEDAMEAAELSDAQAMAAIAGIYVLEGYDAAETDADWVAATVTPDPQTGHISIAVRSRTDIKKPTCTFDADCQKLEQNIYFTEAETAKILFKFEDNKLIIDTENEADRDALHFYCSGGATLAGTYIKGEQLPQAIVEAFE